MSEKALFVNTTDGVENTSRKFYLDTAKTMIDRCRGNGWEFLFMGANTDAVESAGAMDIAQEYSANYHDGSVEIIATFANVACTVSEMRSVVMGNK